MGRRRIERNQSSVCAASSAGGPVTSRARLVGCSGSVKDWWSSRSPRIRPASRCTPGGEQGPPGRIDAEADNQRAFIRWVFKGPPCAAKPGPDARRALHALTQRGQESAFIVGELPIVFEPLRIIHFVFIPMILSRRSNDEAAIVPGRGYVLCIGRPGAHPGAPPNERLIEPLAPDAEPAVGVALGLPGVINTTDS
jgi:hypothetical protein